MVKEITNVNDVILDIGNVAKVPVSDFSFERAEDSGEIHGSGHPQARGYTRGNITFSVSITVEGEIPELMLGILEDDGETGRSTPVKIVATGDHYKQIYRGVIFTDEEYGGSDGDVVEYSADGFATRRDTEALNGTDL
jgi:hypothetical protein